MELTRTEKVNKLKEVSSQLKKEFIGLDSIIDQVVDAVTPWYVTPEILTRPVVVSLWGMTGTGKSSVVKRLIELLNVTHKTLFVDCGEQNNNYSHYKLADQISAFVGNDDDTGSNNDPLDCVFVFDEFQHGRTVDECAKELDKPVLRPIWSLLDSGIINLNEFQYGVSMLYNFVKDLKDFTSRYPGIPAERGIVSDPQSVEKIVNELGFLYYGTNPFEGEIQSSRNRYIAVSPSPRGKKKKNEEDDESKVDPRHDPINVISITCCNQFSIFSHAYPIEKGGVGALFENLLNATSLDEIASIYTEAFKYVLEPKKVNCSKSLVFVIGNLDEAFQIGEAEENMNPDMDADVFHNATSKVTIYDIKTALHKRFRPEQVARLGNNLIKYPTLKKTDFEKIIEMEVGRIFKEFESIEGLKIEYGKDILDMAYSEGVFPTQGVRPIFTTIGTLFMPLLSSILLVPELDRTKTYLVKVLSEFPDYLGYRVPEVKLQVFEKGTDNMILSLPFTLQLGSLRYPNRKKDKYASSVHEMGHAIAYSYLFKELPARIVSVSVDDGGFCRGEGVKTLNSQSIMNRIMVAMAGYAAELLVYGENSTTAQMMWSGSDLSKAWNDLTKAAYQYGLITPRPFANPEILSCGCQTPQGDTNNEKDLQDRIIKIWDDLFKNISAILLSEKELLKQGALKLATVGSMTDSNLLELIKEYGNELSEEWLVGSNQEEWYKGMLEKF